MPSLPTTEPRLPLFAFGTLRRGEANHRLLENRFDRCLPATLPGFCRTIASHGFLVVIVAAGETVEGELFFLRDETYDESLRRCDELEDISPGETSGPYYRRVRRIVTTSEGPHAAWVYADPLTPAD
jgi:gamma-glutamylcyclotransferase (GGCT)/AIG2-like uncharacterized protein YtfP